jgi:2,6-dihydroxypyridine 3-monooxygenase
VLRVVVVGGSVGGLTAANLLRDAGADVTVLERTPVPLEGRGAGIVQHPMTVKYLVERAAVDVDALSTPARWRRYVDRSGDVLVEEDHGYRFTGYSTLYGGLRTAFGDGDHRLGHVVVDLTDVDGDRPSAVVEGGEAIEGDLIICADGIGGTGRSILWGDAVQSTYAGYVAWRGYAEESVLPPDVVDELGDAITFHLMPDHHSHILTYPIPPVDGGASRLINFVWYRNVPAGTTLQRLLTAADGSVRPTSVPPGMVAWRNESELREHAADVLPPAMQSLLAHTAQPFVQVIGDVSTPAMVRGRACVIGDGAFSVRPHTAAATAKAAADAWTLVDALVDAGAIQDPTAVPAALAAWEPGQVALGQRLLARARDLGHRSQVEGSWVPGDPSLGFGLYEAGDSVA